MSEVSEFGIVLVIVSLLSTAGPASVAGDQSDGARPSKPSTRIDYSGKKQYGVMSYYAKHSTHKKTASGAAMDPQKMTAASKTLPMGAKVKVTNTDNGKSANVTINDRGPFVKGRIIDVTPKAADKLGLKAGGISKVEVKPITVPQPDGEVKHVDDSDQKEP